MTFTPVVAGGGLAGLRFLDRTYERQLAVFSKAPSEQRLVDDFLARAGSIRSAEELVGDTRILSVVLGAFGLDDELPKRAFIRRVLEDGTIDPGSLANRLADPAWRELSSGLGFGDAGGRLSLESVRSEIAERYRVRRFERAVGESDVNLRLAMNFRREIGEIATSDAVGRSGWFRVIGSQPLRRVVTEAFALPDSIGKLDIELQRERFEDRALNLFGGRDPSVFRDPAVVERTVERFLLRAEALSGPRLDTRGGAALQLLTSTGLGPAARMNLFRAGLTG